MKRTLRVFPDAEAELQSAAMWYEEKRRGLGIELVAVVDRAFESVLENPEACRVWRPDRPYRRLLLKHFACVVFLRVDDRDRGRGACQATRWFLAGSSALAAHVREILRGEPLWVRLVGFGLLRRKVGIQRQGRHHDLTDIAWWQVAEQIVHVA